MFLEAYCQQTPGEIPGNSIFMTEDSISKAWLILETNQPFTLECSHNPLDKVRGWREKHKESSEVIISWKGSLKGQKSLGATKWIQLRSCVSSVLDSQRDLGPFHIFFLHDAGEITVCMTPCVQIENLPPCSECCSPSIQPIFYLTWWQLRIIVKMLLPDHMTNFYKGLRNIMTSCWINCFANM